MKFYKIQEFYGNSSSMASTASAVLADNYERGEVQKTEKDPKEEFLPHITLPENTIVVRVKRGSKIKNLMAFVEKSLKEEETRQIVFSGCGDAIEKTITCVEITKNNFEGLHQITRLNVFRVEEFWEPTKPELDRLEVIREIPLVAILLSKDPLDPSQLGYQAPTCETKASKMKKKKPTRSPYDKKTVKSRTEIKKTNQENKQNES